MLVCDTHFSQYMAAEVEGGDLEELMAKVIFLLLRLSHLLHKLVCAVIQVGVCCYTSRCVLSWQR